MRIAKRMWLVIAMGAAMALAACSSSSSGGGGGGNSISADELPGTWSGQFRDDTSGEDPLFVHDTFGDMTVEFEVDGDTITGVITITNDICDATVELTADIEGMIDGDSLEFSYTSPSDPPSDPDSISNAPVVFTAELNDPMQGDYDATACHETDIWVGTFELEKE